jgi:UDP-N-acetylmuramoylalanine--D-glutamate ligase
VVDDHIDDDRRLSADELDVELLSVDDAVRVLDGFELYSPSPGVPDSHSVFGAARASRIEICGELELAYRFEAERPGGPRPMIGITGTDGKTSTTLMAEAILTASGRHAVAAGNTDLPLIEAIELDVDSFVVECTSFRLATTEQFRCGAAAWLNFAPDHLDWHRDLLAYESAKARIFSQQRDGDVAIGVIDDETVARHLTTSAARRVSVGLATGDYRVVAGELVGPSGTLMAVGDLYRSLPHDCTNALVAAALCLEAGLVEESSVAAALATFSGPAHRIEFVGESEGVAWFNDSKATTPNAALTALRGFDSVVLVAGGRNKGLDLQVLSAEAPRVRAVVAIGEAATEIESVFSGHARVVIADSMADAVRSAGGLARPGDVVLLSPACASFDWYQGGYQARGDDFKAEVAEQVLGVSGLSQPHGDHEEGTDDLGDA